MAGIFPAPQPQKEEPDRRWVPIAVGGAIVVIIVALFAIFGRSPKPTSGEAPQPTYASNLQISDLKLSVAENFVGASVHYLDGKITNSGSQTVAGCRIEAIFRNSMGQIVGKENQPLMVLETRAGFGYEDITPLVRAPLAPNQTRQFRLTFEHISADWNQGYPELRVTALDLK